MIGHNSFGKDKLRAIVERIERLEDEKQILSADIRDVYTEAKSSGFDVKALRTIIRIRRQDEAERREQEAILDTYLDALGMLPIEEAIAAASVPADAIAGAANQANTSDPPFITPDPLDVSRRENGGSAE